MRNQLKNQKNIQYKTHLGQVDDIQVSDHINYAIPNLDKADQIAGSLWLLYDDNGLTVTWDEISGEFTFNGSLNQNEVIEIFEFLISDGYLYLLDVEYVYGTTDGEVKFISGEEEGVTYTFNGDKLFKLEYIDYILFRFNAEDNYNFEDFRFKLKLNKALYTGEKIDQYSEEKSLRVVPLNKMGKVYNEQMGLIYDYVYTLQHTGEPLLNEGTLVWLKNNLQQNPDFIVRGVVTSLNSTIYHLIKKEA